MATTSWRVRALKASRPSNPDPIKLRAGDVVEIAGKEDDGWVWCRHHTGKEGWAPVSYLTADGEGNTRTARFDYDASELPVEVGEEFQARLEEHGWLWCESSQGTWGWVRVAHVENINEA